ncbi:hypothetical protein BDP27DRAFT_1438217 [Rhodocollybia butyracea]|uniref:Uncharacterized protein n=1 Tax=Rhodocollybia butyracea TaxID=206335 RepID=A0A9P5P4N3_9AGAR|nr:hypothetical protein BDP27DRAFT_1438217 [Rhodocollybia butyracea]
MGQNGDHAANEKAIAKHLRQWKKSVLVEEMGEKKLTGLGLADLILYLASWNAKKIADTREIDAWNALTPWEQADIDSKLMKAILRELGEAAYDGLPSSEKREVDRFIWAGCCMHKNLNSFKGGNTEMMLKWAKIQVDPPVLLANKDNAAELHKIFSPGVLLDKLNAKDAKRAQELLELSARGGVKVTALAGAIFNNKDDKKGQGDTHINHFRAKFGDHHHWFPDTSNTRFGSHGLAACELLKHHAEYIQFLNNIAASKGSNSHTNIEKNVLEGLKDKGTLTELVAMGLYTKLIHHPYMRLVRGPGTEQSNILDLGPLHHELRNHIQGLLDSPDLIFGDGIVRENKSRW